MNKFKENYSDNENPQKAPRKKSALRSSIIHVFGGDFLNTVAKISNLPFTLFVALLIGFYIANTLHAERTIRETDRTNSQLKDFRDEYISLKSELMFLSNQSQVAILVKPIGLLEANEPPHKLIIQSQNQSNSNNP
jgi:cell division protein FtsL